MLQADIFFFIVACLFSLRLSLRRPRLSVRTRFYLRLRSLFMLWISKIAGFMEKEMHINYMYRPWTFSASILFFRERYIIIYSCGNFFKTFCTFSRSSLKTVISMSNIVFGNGENFYQCGYPRYIIWRSDDRTYQMFTKRYDISP